MTWAWERGEKLMMLPDQHLGRNTAFKMGVPLDRWSCGIRTRPGAVSRPAQVQAGEADPVEGALLGPHALHRGADRRLPQEVSRRQGHRASRVHVRRRPGGRCQRLDRVHHQHGEEQPARDRLGRRDRSPPRQPARDTRSRRTRPSSRSIRSAACARRCSASRRTTCCGSSKGCVDGKIHNQIIVPERQKRGARLALDRMLTV